MKVLFSGVSSFTGYWLVKELIEQGHSVTGILTNNLSAYQGIRAIRLKNLQDLVKYSENTPFGKEKFLSLAKNNCFDIYCHHSAFMESYRSLDYDFVRAIQNDGSMRIALQALKEGGTKALVYTGSIFEPGEGAGSDSLRGFSPYGVTKAALFNFFKFFCQNEGIKIGKFVIPNPFGPFEEMKFTSYLMKSWYENKTPNVKTPDYIRDNIHVDLLAKVYVMFCNLMIVSDREDLKIYPSQYVESQGQFAERFRLEMSKRIGWVGSLDVTKQTEFIEPMIRINKDPALQFVLNWDEDLAWDSLADFYKNFQFSSR